MAGRAVRRSERSARARLVSAALREAGDLFAPPERLTDLAERWGSHPAVAETLARNPSAPPQALGELLARVPFAVARNPALILAPLEDPEFLLRASPLALSRLLFRTDVPEPLLLLLSAHPDPTVREAASGHVGLADEETLDEFSVFFAGLPPGSDEVRRQLVATGAIERRWLFGRVGRLLDAPWLGRGIADEGSQLQLLALRSPRTDPDEFVGALSPFLRLGALLNPRLGRSAISARSADSHKIVRALAAQRLENPIWRFRPEDAWRSDGL